MDSTRIIYRRVRFVVDGAQHHERGVEGGEKRGSIGCHHILAQRWTLGPGQACARVPSLSSPSPACRLPLPVGAGLLLPAPALTIPPTSLSPPHTHPLCLHTYTRTLAHPHENPATTTTTTTAATSRPAVPSGCAPARRPWCVATGCSCTCPSGEVVCSSTEAVIPLYPGPGH